LENRLGVKYYFIKAPGKNVKFKNQNNHRISGIPPLINKLKWRDSAKFKILMQCHYEEQ